ncbi:hypothetical protein [Streptomyces camelliae]|uniref:Serine/arginine repetitive matrix protein 2 n=1 Tax=Streptomyces camelliae TaxID=3004093 RepID=A0ABY7NT94_9ACTN|nr:hypothetical protein [Streptomyces sp. HUAS 2-6]WBO61426.1 hypothetical protein O1G22_00260 [Streptomyces sp. HUAS 2-6]
MSGASGDSGIRWNDETQRWESAGEAGTPVPPSPPPPPVPAYGPSQPVEDPYDLAYTVTPPPAPTRRSRRTTALVAAATVAAVSGGIAGGVLAVRGDGGHGGTGSGPASMVSASETATSGSGPTGSGLPTDTGTVGAWSTDSPSSSPTDVPPAYVLQEDASGFTIAVPDGWQREEKSNGIFYNSPDGRSLLQVFAITEPDMTPRAALTETSHTLAKNNKNYKEISLQDVSQDSGEPAAELVYAYDRPDGTRRQVIDHAFGTDTGKQYAVLVAGPENDWPRQRDILQIALAHFSP